MFQGKPPKKKGLFFAQNGLKMPMFGQKQFFLCSGGEFKALAPYFAGGGPRTTCGAGYGSQKIGVPGTITQKMFFFAPDGLKMPILGQKQCFFGLRPPYFAGARLKRTCVAGHGNQETGDSGPPQPKNAHFLPKNGLKMPILGRMKCSLGSASQLKPPPTLSCWC